MHFKLLSLERINVECCQEHFHGILGDNDND